MDATISGRVEAIDIADIASEVSFADICAHPMVRLQLLHRVRSAEGGTEIIPALSDLLRTIATSKPDVQGALEETLADLLASIGMTLEQAGSPDGAPSTDSHVEQSVQSTVTSAVLQGFAGSRPTPQFPTPVSTPVSAPTPAVVVPVANVVPAPAPELISVPVVPPETLSVASIKESIDRIKAEVGLQRFMEALKGATTADKEYVAAYNALSALGPLDSMAIDAVRPVYERFSHAAATVLSTAPVTADTPVIGEASPMTTVPENVGGVTANDDAVVAVVPPTPLVQSDVVVSAPVDTTPTPEVVAVAEEPVVPAETGVTLPAEIIAEPEPPAQDTPEVASWAAPVVETEIGTDPTESVVEMPPPPNATEAVQQSDAPPEVDVLMDPEVTKGLEQLLAEWPIFEKSGLLGFGPHGSAHPLYKKLSNLSVAEVASGRWEGTDPKVVQSIQAYMAGWKQDRGIDADPDEVFEAYLRRVIADILQISSLRAGEQKAA